MLQLCSEVCSGDQRMHHPNVQAVMTMCLRGLIWTLRLVCAHQAQKRLPGSKI